MNRTLAVWGSRVRRWHTHEALMDSNDYTDGHAARVAQLLICMMPSPGPSKWLLQAAIMHDVAEKWIGDVPGPTKAANSCLAQIVNRLENDRLAELDIAYWLNEDELDWLNFADKLDGFLWCRKHNAHHGPVEKIYLLAEKLGVDLSEHI